MAAKRSGVVEQSGGAVSKKENVSARPYQLELLDAAINDDTIVNLGTGAGKTFIAVMLIKELSAQVLRRFSEEGAKRTVFLVTTVPLVKQQAEYILHHTHLKVGQYTGDLGVDSWTLSRWRSELEHVHVLVMTMTIFKNLLLQSYLKLSQVNLVVFDECHHAVKNHDYVQIMRIFKPHIENKDDNIPRRLGLTASLIPSKCNPGDIERKIKDLEEVLVCRSQTAGDLQQVAKFATNPDEQECLFPSSSSDQRSVELKCALEESVNFLELFKREDKDKDVYDKVRLYLDDCLHILINLGVWCANEFAVEGLPVLEISMSELGCCRWEKALLHMGWTQLKMLTEKCATIIETYKRKGDHTPFTPKVKNLLVYLGDTAVSTGEISKSEADHLRGIVFVERRTTALLLTKLIQQKSKSDEDLKHIRCDYIVGHNEGKKGNHLRKEANMKTSKQELVLEKFRDGRLNLLVATSVVEEGVDVPKCNAVVRFDFPPNFRSYMQSKGRARAKVSKYLLFIEEEEKGKKFADLSDYRALEKELQNICQGRSVPGEEEVLKRMEELVDPYMPYGIEGARATLGSSLSLVHRYCQKLPRDKYTVLTPVFVTKEKKPVEDVPDLEPAVRDAAEGYVYQRSLELPMNCPLKHSITGSWMPTVKLADKSAALEAVKQLHQAREMNSHLIPVGKMTDSDDEHDGSGGVGGASERKRKYTVTTKSHYPNKVAPCLSGCFPEGADNHLYILMVEEQTLSQTQRNNPVKVAVGLVTSKPLPHATLPEFSLYDGDKTLIVNVLHYRSRLAFSEEELSVLKDSHAAIFSQVLHITGPHLQVDFEHSVKNYLIVPVVVLVGLSPLEVYIDMELADKLAKMNNSPSVKKPTPPEDWPRPLHDVIVKTVHKQDSGREVYQVLKVDTGTTLKSPFPDQMVASTYQDYYREKYNCDLSDKDESAIIVKQLGLSDSRLKMLLSRYKDHEGEQLKTKRPGREIKLFRSLCHLYPVGAEVWYLLRCLPSLLWRLECLTLVDSLRSQVTKATGIGRCDHTHSLILTNSSLRGYQDYGCGVLQTQRISFVDGEEPVAKPLPDADLSLLRGPDNTLLLQALTPKGAQDSVNLERLETLGDSFLKLSTSVFLFCDRPIDHEGKLSISRARRVGNSNLYLLAKCHNIPSYLLSSAFEPRQMWMPPGFVLVNNHTEGSQTSEMDLVYNHHEATDKGVADCVESLIGAYLVSGGIEAALKFMKWIGIKLHRQQIQTDVSTSQTCSGVSSSYFAPPTSKTSRTTQTNSLYFSNSSSIFTAHFGAASLTSLTEEQEHQLERLLQISSGSSVSERLKWDFKERSLLLQALTHASYTRNRVTDCYQRLEFLGDAVLDYLVTCHIYSSFPKYSPGDISNLRSALVNNVTFAELSVNLELHKCFLYNSPSLFKQIEDYIRSVGRSHGNTKVLEEIYCHSENCLEAELKQDPLQGDSDDVDIDELDPPKVLGDLLESLAGAVFIDSGMSLESVWTVFRQLFEDKIASFHGTVPIPPLQELLDREPTAEVKNETERSSTGRFRCSITVLDKGIKICAEANHPKNARGAAARAALKKLNHLSV